MKNYLRISIIIALFGSFIFSCTPNDVSDGDLKSELSEEHANDVRKKNREDPSDDDD